MGYYMRYISADERPLSLAQIGEALVAIDPRYLICPTDLDELVEVVYDDKLYGQIEINTPGDELFEDDISAFMEMLSFPPRRSSWPSPSAPSSGSCSDFSPR